MKRQKMYIFKDEQDQKMGRQNEDSEDVFVIRSIGSLLGSTGSCLTMGMLSDSEGGLFLEDGLQKVRLDVSQSSAPPGFILAGHVVLVEGDYLPGVTGVI